VMCKETKLLVTLGISSQIHPHSNSHLITTSTMNDICHARPHHRVHSSFGKLRVNHTSCLTPETCRTPSIWTHLLSAPAWEEFTPRTACRGISIPIPGATNVAGNVHTFDRQPHTRQAVRGVNSPGIGIDIPVP
jgi:hypothetical protein